ncbi:hypothetical protein BSFP_067560 [Burkholderia stabilis]|uniref:Uncharacterized protein n=1 Tax=Burkholderia stabilis TaxID=95485 RepID=A0A1Y1BV50_9BURK|nr:hypothetical protein BSFP_067560 [Burkholderia stabilis]
MIDSVAFGGDMRRCYRETVRAHRLAPARQGLITKL